MTLGFGIIGYGGIGEWHARHIPRVEGLAVTAVHDVLPERVAEARANGIRSYDSLSAFLNDSSVDVVVIATPNDSHMELAVAAAAAGKHVIVEKPAALSLSQFDEMIGAAKRHHVLLSVHQNRRWDKDYRMMRQVVESGQIGKAYMVQSRVHGPNGYLHGWRAQKEYGGGMMYDWGVHLLDQLLWWNPAPVKQVECRFRSLLNPEVDDYFHCVVEFADGLLAQVEVGTLCLRPLPRWYVIGDKGSLRIEALGGKEGGFSTLIEGPKASNRQMEDTPAGPTRTFAANAQAKHSDQPLPTVDANWLDYYRNYAAAVAGREQLVVQPSETRRVLSVMEAAFESGRTGLPVTPAVPAI